MLADPMGAVGATKGTLPVPGQPQRFSTGAMEPTTPSGARGGAAMAASGYTADVAPPSSRTRGISETTTRVEKETKTQPRGPKREQEEEVKLEIRFAAEN